MGPREPEDLYDVLPDERDLCPRVEKAVHHYVISVRPVGASTGDLEALTQSALSDQEALVGPVRLRGPV
ncbi:hypothetical protein T4D_12651 [Trichinella pseudospiralis]|uniref:Uncharacterized protein n=1 Tax=Trichinella pseudospiralis TaxID=6337 RepID=A0A0V1G0T9_TRIPS|nr:hypothetical protein T4D_12651 [Trichinella pseudospiralis]